jgi:hypothetical protein
MSTALRSDPDILIPDTVIGVDHNESDCPWLVPDPDHSVIWPVQQKIVVPEITLGQKFLGLKESGAPNVRFSREIRQGFMGKDITGHKRALSRARPDLYEWGQFTNYAGPFFLDAIIKYKQQHGLGSARVLGGVMHESLERQRRKGYADEWAFDGLAIELCQEYWDESHTTPDQRVRGAIVQAGMYWYAHRFSIAYSQYRPFELGRPAWIPTRWDCSAFVTNCHYAGGAPNPNMRPWDHLGYTGTLMLGGERVQSVSNLLPGDLIFYGASPGSVSGFPAGSPTHVALYAGRIGGTHMVLSMGSYPMKYAAYNYRHDINHFRHYKVTG